MTTRVVLDAPLGRVEATDDRGREFAVVAFWPDQATLDSMLVRTRVWAERDLHEPEMEHLDDAGRAAYVAEYVAEMNRPGWVQCWRSTRYDAEHEAERLGQTFARTGALVCVVEALPV